jgi:FkbM family methyltransferase
MGLKQTIAAQFGYDLRKAHKSDKLEFQLRRYFSNHPIGLVIDCGAHIGRFAKQCRKSGYNGKILSFEPSSRQYAALLAGVGKDPEWQGFNIGLGDVAGDRDLHISKGKGDLNSLFNSRPEMHRRFKGLESVGVERVFIDRLDSMLERLGISNEVPIFIKSDTQGNDLNVLRGAGARLRQTIGMMLELSVQALYHGSPSHWQVLEFVRASGFELYGFSTVSRDKKGGGVIEYDALFRRVIPSG